MMIGISRVRSSARSFLASATPDYMAVQLNADKGPLGTNNYRINLRKIRSI